MDKEELDKISKSINDYASKYHCRIELEENFDGYYTIDMKEKYKYKVIAIKKEIIES